MHRNLTDRPLPHAAPLHLVVSCSLADKAAPPVQLLPWQRTTVLEGFGQVFTRFLA